MKGLFKDIQTPCFKKINSVHIISCFGLNAGLINTVSFLEAANMFGEAPGFTKSNLVYHVPLNSYSFLFRNVLS